jgi:hypothetical protein
MRQVPASLSSVVLYKPVWDPCFAHELAAVMCGTLPDNMFCTVLSVPPRLPLLSNNPLVFVRPTKSDRAPTQPELRREHSDSHQVLAAAGNL